MSLARTIILLVALALWGCAVQPQVTLPAPYTQHGVSIAVDGLWRDASGNVSGVSGIATNVTGRDLLLVTVTLDVLDATGIKVASAAAITNGLKAAQRWRFQAPFTNLYSVTFTTIAPGETTVIPATGTEQGSFGTQPLPANRSTLGVTMNYVTPDLAESAKMGKARGFVIIKVEPESPAAKAGLVRGDIVLAYGGKPIATPSEMLAAIGAHGPDDQMTIWRAGREQTVIIRY